MGKQKKRKGNGIFLFLFLLVLAAVIVLCAIKILDGMFLNPVYEIQEPVSTKTVVKDGVSYFPRQDITVMLVLGIDQAGPVQSSNYYRNKGAADSIMMLIFDETNHNCSVLYLNRDTMLDMDVLGVTGDYAGTNYGQLALAHTYGEGLEDSCLNMKNTISKYLKGMNTRHSPDISCSLPALYPPKGKR